MMSDSVWVVPKDMASTFGDAGISSSYIIPRLAISFDVSDLVGAYLWVVLRGDSDRIGLSINVDGVSEITDGYYSGDYLITTCIYRSFRIGPDYESVSEYETDAASDLDHGISKIDQLTSEAFSEAVRNNVSILLRRPNNAVLSRIGQGIREINLALGQRSVIRSAISSLTLVEIWGNGNVKELRSSPFASVSLEYINKKTLIATTKDEMYSLVSLDPINAIMDGINATRIAAAGMQQAPLIDNSLYPINPDKIFARRFISRAGVLIDNYSAIKKTEAAENTHQEILRDISKYLIENGIIPLQSRSVDLAYELGTEIILVEIKSANNENAITQAAKGAFQLASYHNSFEMIHKNIKTILLMESVGSSALSAFISNALERLGIKMLIYEHGKPWPGRVELLPMAADSQ